MDSEDYWAELVQIDIDRELRLAPLIGSRVWPPKGARAGDVTQVAGVPIVLRPYHRAFDVDDGVFERAYPDPQTAPAGALGLVTASRWHDSVMYSALRESAGAPIGTDQQQSAVDWLRLVMAKASRPDWIVASFRMELELEAPAARHRVQVIGCGSVVDGAPALAGIGKPVRFVQGVSRGYRDSRGWPRNVMRVAGLAGAGVDAAAEVRAFVEPVMD